MCGICGVIGLAGEEGTRLVDQMTASIHHRGPDETGQFAEGGVALGHKRLSIIDLGGGQQPMRTADGRYVLVYNGEIYNYRELRDELVADLVSKQGQFAVFIGIEQGPAGSDVSWVIEVHAAPGGGPWTAFAWADETGQICLLARGPRWSMDKET